MRQLLKHIALLFDMFLNALRLFARGRLFRNPREVLRQWLIGVGACLALFLLLDALGVALGACVVLTALAGGLLQPWLFRNLKYD